MKFIFTFENVQTSKVCIFSIFKNIQNVLNVLNAFLIASKNDKTSH